jgi:hypothetical protein
MLLTTWFVLPLLVRLATRLQTSTWKVSGSILSWDTTDPDWGLLQLSLLPPQKCYATIALQILSSFLFINYPTIHGYYIQFNGQSTNSITGIDWVVCVPLQKAKAVIKRFNKWSEVHEGKFWWGSEDSIAVVKWNEEKVIVKCVTVHDNMYFNTVTV